MLSKKEIIYRYLLDQYFEKKQFKFTQSELAKFFHISLSTVNNALKPLRAMGAVEVKSRSFNMLDSKKLILYSATIRKFEKDIIYSTRYENSVSEMEKLMPSGAVFTAYSAYRFAYKDAPSDYSEIYVYLSKEELIEIKERFPPKTGSPNLFVLEKDSFIRKNKVSSSQIFVDLWNIRTWYAKEYLDAVEKRLFL
ncbi:MAG: helix-turn-helix domain-containing protein [Candidatus Micrarchaeota archaeon]